MIRTLVETGFLMALNPKDRNHSWAMNNFEDARMGKLEVNISPAAPLELALILKSKGLMEDKIARVMEALDLAIRRWTNPRYPPLDLSITLLSSKLRHNHPQLTFFDSIHAAISLSNDLIYYDLDDEVRDVIRAERDKVGSVL